MVTGRFRRRRCVCYCAMNLSSYFPPDKPRKLDALSMRTYNEYRPQCAILDMRNASLILLRAATVATVVANERWERKRKRERARVCVYMCIFNIKNNIFSGYSFFSNAVFAVNIELRKIFKYRKPHEILFHTSFMRKKKEVTITAWFTAFLSIVLYQWIAQFSNALHSKVK